MAAKLQRALIYLIALLASISMLGFGYSGYWTWGIVAVIFLVSLLAIVLAIEFVFLWQVEKRPSRYWIENLFVSWLREVVAYIASFGWEQPFRSKSIHDSVPVTPDGRRAVLLIHGLCCNRGFWNPFMRRLRGEGHLYLAIDLEPMFGSIEDYTNAIDVAVRRLKTSTGLSPVILAHSMGGLAVRHWLCTVGDQNAVQRIICVGTPH